MRDGRILPAFQSRAVPSPELRRPGWGQLGSERSRRPTMILIRPVDTADLDALVELASDAGFGLTTLPHDRELLRKRILKSQRSFRDMGDSPAGETYLFVAEDVSSRRVVGTSGIVSKVGGFQPFYAYRLENSLHQSEILGVHKEIRTLHLVAEHNGPSEIGSLFLAPDFRRDSN